MEGLREEKACGAVIIRDNKVLLVYQQNGFWGFPKGHIEEGETEVETAKREVEEEVGLEVEIDEAKRFTFSYIIKDSKIHKTVVLFLAKVREREGPAKDSRGGIERTNLVDDNEAGLERANLAEDNESGLELQKSEIKEAKWVPIQEVMERLTFREWREVWAEILQTLV